MYTMTSPQTPGYGAIVLKAGHLVSKSCSAVVCLVLVGEVGFLSKVKTTQT